MNRPSQRGSSDTDGLPLASVDDATRTDDEATSDDATLPRLALWLAEVSADMAGAPTSRTEIWERRTDESGLR